MYFNAETGREYHPMFYMAWVCATEEARGGASFADWWGFPKLEQAVGRMVRRPARGDVDINVVPVNTHALMRDPLAPWPRDLRAPEQWLRDTKREEKRQARAKKAGPTGWARSKSAPKRPELRVGPAARGRS
jgi:hypothetical protein